MYFTLCLLLAQLKFGSLKPMYAGNFVKRSFLMCRWFLHHIKYHFLYMLSTFYFYAAFKHPLVRTIIFVESKLLRGITEQGKINISKIGSNMSYSFPYHWLHLLQICKIQKINDVDVNAFITLGKNVLTM